MQPSERPPFHFRLENTLVVAVLAVMAILPLIEIAGRVVIGRGISGSIVVVQNLTLWITVLGAATATLAALYRVTREFQTLKAAP